jgi:hypothetical protein
VVEEVTMAKILECAHYVVVWDPAGTYWEGALVDAQKARVLSAAPHHVVLLPVIPDLFMASSVGGFSKRAWGAGVPLSTHAPRFVAPLTLFMDPKIRGMVWRARLVPDLGERPARYVGILRFAADTGQRMPNKAMYRELTDHPVALEKLGEPDADGGWTVGGEGVATAPSEGHYGFSIYAAAPGLRVVWVAASTVPVEV